MASKSNMGLRNRLQFSIFCYVLLNLFVLCASLYEDQIGKFDWRKQYVGQVHFAYFDQSGQTGRRVIVGTDHNVIASLNARTGQIVWRQILESSGPDQTQINDMIYFNNRVVSVTSGGSHVRCWSASQGDLLWDVSLTPKIGQRAQITVINKLNRVIVLTKDSLSSINIESGKVTWTQPLPDSETVTYKFVESDEDIIRVYGFVAGSHVVVVTVTVQGEASTLLTIAAAWMTQDKSCELTASGCLVCVDAASSSIYFMQSPSSSSFTTQTLRDLGLDTDEPALFSFRRTASAISQQDIGLHVASNHLTILRIKGSMLTVIKDLTGVSAAQLVTHSGQEVLLTLARQKNDVVEMKAYDASSGGEIADFTQKIPYPSHHGLPKQVYGLMFKRKDGVTGLRALVINEDHSLLMAQHSGAISWTREEALSNIRSVEMVDLPVSENQAKMEDEFGSREDDIVAMFVKRISTQVSQIKTFLFHLKNKLRLSRQHQALEVAESEEDEEEDDEDYLTRDDFNLHKMVVLATSAGKVYGMDSMKGRIIWQHFIPNLAPFKRFGQDTLLLLVQRTTAHFPHTPQCVLLGTHKKTGRGLLYVFNPITGEPVESANGIHLDFGIQQASLLVQNDDQFLKGLLMLGTDKKYHTYPSSTKPLVEEMSSSMFMFTADSSTGVLTGYGIQHQGHDLLADQVWTVNLQRDVQIITNVAMKRAAEHVHSQGIVMGDRSVLYKYLNPNLMVVTAEGVDSQQKAFLNVYLIDAVSGQIVFHCNHKRSKGPVHVVHSENWVVYDYWNQKNRRTEMVVLDLFEGKKQSNATTFSSLHPPPPPLVMRQSYVLSSHISSAAVSITEKGITSKHVLLALKTGGILELPKMFLDSRRPVVYTMEHREEGLMPYTPELPRPFEHMINYNHSVYKIHGIHTAPAGLESTSLVLAYGLDLFFTRVTPSKMFDVIKEDFDYFFISSVLVGMTLLSALTQKLAARKALNRAWK